MGPENTKMDGEKVLLSAGSFNFHIEHCHAFFIFHMVVLELIDTRNFT